jgi:diguanylate cyclase (GGDEF)-like protein
MDKDRRSETSVGARMRDPGGWGAWSKAGLAAAEAPRIERRQRPRGERPALVEGMVDAVTGLPSRALLADRLDRALRRAKRNRYHTALLFIDVEGWEEVLAAHGQAAADELIATLGKRLQQSVRETDTVARLASDEFAVILEGVHSPAIAERLAQKLAAVIARPGTLLVEQEGKPLEMKVSACIGVALYPDQAQSFDDFVATTELALGQARLTGGVRLYQEGAETVEAVRAVG